MLEFKELKSYDVQYWIYINDDYDSVDVTVKAISSVQAIKIAKSQAPSRAKKFRIT